MQKLAGPLDMPCLMCLTSCKSIQSRLPTLAHRSKDGFFWPYDFYTVDFEMSRLIASKELEKITGLTRQTIQDYVKSGWVLEPQFHSAGRAGATLMWPISVVYQLDMINVLKKAGYKNQDIGRILKGESL